MPDLRIETDRRKARGDLQVGVDSVTSAITAMARGRHTLRAAGSPFARYHLVRAAFAGALGQPQSAVYQLGAYALMTRPGLVKALFTLPPQSVRWEQAAAALNAILEPFAPQSTAPAQRVPLPQ